MVPNVIDERPAIVADRLRHAERVCCLTGAGISAESGIPTFRGPDGFWAGRSAFELATPEAFARDPETVWRFYLWRRSQLVTKRPNAGHHALAAIERAVPHFTLATQNVDGLHRAAGSVSILELHGDLMIDRCTACGRESRAATNIGFDAIPHCMECNAMMRPGVVWFGEMLPEDAMRRADAAARSCQVMLVVGTSSVVYPAAGLAELARMHGAFTVEINPEETPLSRCMNVRFRNPSGEALPAMVEAMNRSDAR